MGILGGILGGLGGLGGGAGAIGAGAGAAAGGIGKGISGAMGGAAGGMSRGMGGMLGGGAGFKPPTPMSYVSPIPKMPMGGSGMPSAPMGGGGMGAPQMPMGNNMGGMPMRNPVNGKPFGIPPSRQNMGMYKDWSGQGPLPTRPGMANRGINRQFVPGGNVVPPVSMPAGPSVVPPISPQMSSIPVAPGGGMPISNFSKGQVGSPSQIPAIQKPSLQIQPIANNYLNTEFGKSITSALPENIRSKLQISPDTNMSGMSGAKPLPLQRPGMQEMTPLVSKVPGSGFGKPSSIPNSNFGASSSIPSAPPGSGLSSIPKINQSSIAPNSPSTIPTNAPSVIPNNRPSLIPTNAPSVVPSNAPSMIPSNAPSFVPNSEFGTPSFIQSNGISSIPDNGFGGSSLIPKIPNASHIAGIPTNSIAPQSNMVSPAQEGLGIGKQSSGANNFGGGNRGRPQMSQDNSIPPANLRRTRSLTGGSIGNPYLGTGAVDVPTQSGLNRINQMQDAAGLPRTTMLDYGPNAGAGFQRNNMGGPNEATIPRVPGRQLALNEMAGNNAMLSDIGKRYMSKLPKGANADVVEAMTNPELLNKYGITTPEMQRQLMAQAAHETGGFRSSVERGSKDYFNKYEPGTRVGKRLGNTQPGDGYLYRGRGPIQLTGRYNYQHIGDMIGQDLVSNPDLLTDPKIGAEATVAYLQNRVGLDTLKSGNIRAITKKVNGGLNGFKERKMWYNRFNF